MLHRKVNIFFILSLVFVFIIYGEAQDHKQILLGAFFSLILCLSAFLLNWLTIDGAFSATICGTIAYGIAGFVGATAVLLFFVSSSVLSKNFSIDEKSSIQISRRNGLQVWANGFWFSFWFMIWFLSGIDLFLIAGIAAIAASTADTWATEVGGNRFNPKAWLITTGKVVPAGTDGAISIVGTIASLVGATLISLIYYAFNIGSGLLLLSIIAASGFLGSIIDSYLGARFQYKKDDQYLSIGNKKFSIDNNFVNWFSSGMASFISLLATLIISL